MSTVLHAPVESKAGGPSLPTRWVCLAVLFGLLIVLYRESWQSMRHVWDTPTYTHGYLVPFIAVWLAWRQREKLGHIEPANGWSALLPLAAAALLWMAGELAGVDAAQHFAAMTMAVMLVPLVFGWQIAKVLAFPLGFLFFAVPFGEFLLPWMMEATATVTIALVRLCGVPIYREGMSFVLPSGAWQIIEECSGQRYLIAALPLACLYAWISFERNRTRWLFVLMAVAVALLANWIRAWGIVMLGHLSDMKIATGVDHLIYGWGFFGVVMLLLFWIGSRWREAPLSPGERRAREAGTDVHTGHRSGTTSRAWSTFIALLAGACILAASPLLANHLLSLSSGPLDLTSLSGLPGFTRSEGPSAGTAFQPKYEGADREVWLDYQGRSGEAVSAWIGSFEHQRDGGEMIQHGNSIHSRAGKSWTVRAERQAPVSSGQDELGMTEYVLASGPERLLVWRGYRIDGRSTAGDAAAKLLTAWRVARGRGDRSIVIILWTPLDDAHDAARARLSRAVRTLDPALNEKGRRP
jgi:exosortase A